MSILYVKAYHGISTSHNTYCHKPQLLTGLRDRARRIGIRMDLVPVPFVDYCMLEMCGHEVFRCKLQHLKFNTEYTRDDVCDRAIYAIISASVKFRRARACLWFWTALDHQLFRRSKYAPVDYWPIKVDFLGKDKCEDCSMCCYFEKLEKMSESVEAATMPDSFELEKISDSVELDDKQDYISLKSDSYSIDI